MINKIIYFSIQHKFLVVLLLAAIIGGGVYSLRTINVDSTPDITNNQVQVITVSENLSTADIEQFVTYPVELAMSNLPGVEDIRSISRFGLSVVTIVFKEDMGTYLPRQLVQEKLEEVREDIPEGFGTPEMGPISTGLGEILQYTLVPKDTARYSTQELRTIQDWIVKRQLSMIPGVVEVNSFGGSIKQYEVALNPQRLNAMRVSVGEVYEALRKNNVNTGGAYIERDHMASFIRGEGLVKSVDDIENIVVKNVNGTPVLVRDVADKVGFGSQVRYGAFTQNGHEAVGGMIMMLKGANSDKVVRAVKERMESVRKSLPDGIDIKPFLDRSDLIERTTSTIARNLTEGALIVIFVLVLLLGSLRGGLIAASVIPLSLLFALIMMRLFGVSANLMSLGAIDFGIIVDGAVIIVEGTVFEMEKRIKKYSQLGRGGMNAVAFEAASSMMHSAFFGQLIILIVFTPIIFLSGVSGKMFSPMAYTFSFAVLGAIILCLTYVPMISSLLIRPLSHQGGWMARMERRLQRVGNCVTGRIIHVYHPLLLYALRHKKTVLVSAAALFLAAAFAFTRMGGEFVPELDEGDIAMQTFLRPGSSLSETIKREEEVERLLLQSFPEIKTVCARIGVADIPTDPMGFDYTDSFIILEKDRSKWTSAKTKEELIEKIKEKLQILPGLNFSFSQPVALRFNELLTGVREDVAVKLYGDDLDKLGELGERMVSIISRIEGAEDVTLERTDGLPQITVKYDRQRVAQYGLHIDDLNAYVSSAFAGSSAGSVFEGEKRFDLVIRLSDAYRKSIDDLRQLYIPLPSGAQIPLSEVAQIDYESGPMQISREQTSRNIYVGVNVRGRDVQSVVDEIQDKLDQQLRLPAGYRLAYGGEFQKLQEAKNRLMIVLPIALLLIFVLLYFALKSLKQSLMIYMAVPLATVGGVLALLLRGMPFSISAGVGFIVLFGVAVLNGLVLINRFNSLKKEGMNNINRRIIKGTQERIRPILLTATAAMLGFLPMAVSGSAGAEVQRPLATVVIGGLFTATLLTLLVVPLLYALEEKAQRKTANRLPKAAFALMLALLAPCGMQAQQPVSLQQALQLAEQYHPSIRLARMGVSREEAMVKGVSEVGLTELSAGVDELGRSNDATFTLLSVRQNIDVLGNKQRVRTQRQMVNVARADMNLTEHQLRKAVYRDYAQAYILRQRMNVHAMIDSIYQNFEHAAKVRYEARETSKLAYLAAKKKAVETKENFKQSVFDYQVALKALSRWLGEGLYEPTTAPDETLGEVAGSANPILTCQSERVKLAEENIRLEKSKGLPAFFIEGGTQRIGDKNGFWTFDVGVSIPLFRRSYKARQKAAALDRDIENTQFDLLKKQLGDNQARLHTAYQKWRHKLQYYRDTALPTARAQQRGASSAYKLGATDYIGFIQTMGDAVQTELDYWEAYEQFINTIINLQYPTI